MMNAADLVMYTLPVEVTPKAMRPLKPMNSDLRNNMKTAHKLMSKTDYSSYGEHNPQQPEAVPNKLIHADAHAGNTEEKQANQLATKNINMHGGKVCGGLCENPRLRYLHGIGHTG